MTRLAHLNVALQHATQGPLPSDVRGLIARCGAVLRPSRPVAASRSTGRDASGPPRSCRRTRARPAPTVLRQRVIDRGKVTRFSRPAALPSSRRVATASPRVLKCAVFCPRFEARVNSLTAPLHRHVPPVRKLSAGRDACWLVIAADKSVTRRVPARTHLARRRCLPIHIAPPPCSAQRPNARADRSKSSSFRHAAPGSVPLRPRRTTRPLGQLSHGNPLRLDAVRSIASTPSPARVLTEARRKADTPGVLGPCPRGSGLTTMPADADGPKSQSCRDVA